MGELYTPEVILTGLVIIVSLAALILSSFARYRQSKSVQDKTLIVELMTNPEILAAIKNGDHNLTSLVDKIREDEYFKSNKGAFSGALDKIMPDIQMGCCWSYWNDCYYRADDNDGLECYS